MTWAECLATFNFVAWILPILFRTYLAWKKPNDTGTILSTEELGLVSKSISRLNFGNKKLIIGDGRKTDREV